MRSILEPQNNVVMEWDGLKIRFLDPFQGKTDWERARMLREPKEDGLTFPSYPWRISQDNMLKQNVPISINIGSVQSKNLQFGHGTSIHEQQSKEKESVIWKLLKITGAVAAILTILNLLGWLEPIKAFVWPK